MFERSPSYFKQFQKQFKFLVTNKKINWSSVKNFAVCSHFDSEFCQLTKTTSTNHFHVLIDTSNNGNIVKSVKTTVAQKSVHNMILPGKQTQTDNFSSETLNQF